MSKYIEDLEKKAKELHYYEVERMFYDIFIDLKTTIDQIKEIVEYCVYDEWEMSFNPNPNAMYNSVRNAFFNVNQKVNIFDKFDNEYKTRFISKVCPFINYEYIDIYPLEILIKCGEQIDWATHNHKYFCYPELKPIIKKYAENQLPNIFKDADGDIVYYDQHPGIVFWLFVSCGVVFDKAFFQEIVDTQNILFDDYENFVKPIRAYLLEKKQNLVCGNQIPTELYKVLDDLPKDIKVRFLLRDN